MSDVLASRSFKNRSGYYLHEAVTSLSGDRLFLHDAPRFIDDRSHALKLEVRRLIHGLTNQSWAIISFGKLLYFIKPAISSSSSLSKAT